MSLGNRCKGDATLLLRTMSRCSNNESGAVIPHAVPARIRLTEVLSALSLTTDLGSGMPFEKRPENAAMFGDDVRFDRALKELNPADAPTWAGHNHARGLT